MFGIMSVPRRPREAGGSAWGILLGSALLFLRAVTPVPAGDAEVARRFSAAIRAEVEAGHLSGVSVALMDDQRLVMADAAGWADLDRRVPAVPGTVYRVGSISKLFTALAAVQLMEQGRLDLDSPAARYVPEFRPVNPFPGAGEPTLRQLLCHRSGLVREAPVGGYFDPSEPTAHATVASLADCVMVAPPNTRTKYSNSGVTVVGRAVEAIAGVGFAEYQAERVLAPLHMSSSAFALNRSLRRHLAVGRLPVALPDTGFRDEPAPLFEFGILPAGNLYSTAADLGRFMSAIFAEGRGPGGPVVRPDSLAQMMRVQLSDATHGFGLGFSLGQHRGHRTFGHSGAVYGFTSLFLGLPAERLGVIVLASDDLAMGPVRRLGRLGLDLLLEDRKGLPPPRTDPSSPPPAAADLAACAGDFESQSFWARVDVAPGGTGLAATISRQHLDLVPLGDWRFRGNGRIASDAEVVFQRDGEGRVTGFEAMGQTFRRVDSGPAAIRPAWRSFLGSYGPAFIPLHVTERHGHLYAMTENEFDYRLTPLNRTVFAMPPGLYESEHLVFQTDRSGRTHGVILANMPLRRRR